MSGAGSNRLPALAAEMNEAHARATAAMRDAVAHAKAAGAALIEAKAAVGHGKWSAWLSANFKGSARTAQRYMLVARRWATIKTKTTRLSDLTIGEALRLLDGRSELERALALGAETDALDDEARQLKARIDEADADELRYIFDRAGEIGTQLVMNRLRAERECGRLLRELGRDNP